MSILRNGCVALSNLRVKGHREGGGRLISGRGLHGSGGRMGLERVGWGWRGWEGMGEGAGSRSMSHVCHRPHND